MKKPLLKNSLACLLVLKGRAFKPSKSAGFQPRRRKLFISSFRGASSPEESAVSFHCNGSFSSLFSRRGNSLLRLQETQFPQRLKARSAQVDRPCNPLSVGLRGPPHVLLSSRNS